MKTTESIAADDPRMKAFLDANCPEIFHSVATPTAMWQPDPFDVDTIHREAREAFVRLLNRASRTPAAPSGSVLVLLGRAGCGKTHLMRAFRNHAHTGGNGYCGYMQMTTETSNYPRYMLNKLIEGLEQPYTPESNKTGLTRLSSALLDAVPDLTANEREEFRDGAGDPVKLVDEYADRLQSIAKFRNCDVELLRVLLHLERNDTRVRSRALMWLRCLEMKEGDRHWIGDAVPRTDDADPNHMLQHVATAVRAIHDAPLVMLVDQLEDMAKQSAPVERFQKMVDAITAITDQNSNVIVVLACLEDYFKDHTPHLGQAKIDRLMNDPAPIRLRSNCSIEEIRAIAEVRLGYLYDHAGVEIEPRKELFPFELKHLKPLNNFTPRAVLLFLLQHHQRCMRLGKWVEPSEEIEGSMVTFENELDALWNDFANSFNAIIPDEENELAEIIAQAVHDIAPELPEGNHYGQPRSDERYVDLELHSADGRISKMLVAICTKNAKGGGLGKQLDAVDIRAAGQPVSVVRTTDFPRTGDAANRIAAMIKKDGYAVVVQNSDWRRMQAFAAFREKHQSRPDFAAWQKEAKPLGELASLQKLLRLKMIKPAPRPAVTEASQPVATVPKIPPPPPAFVLPAIPPESPPPVANSPVSLNLGNTLGSLPVPVNFEPIEFTYHAAFLGGTGSGKTTAALNLIEQLLAQGIPAVLLDRKGDLCRYADPKAWERPLEDAKRTEARQKLRAKLDISVFTPGEPNGRPLALPIVPPGFDQLAEADREKFAMYAANALGSMLNFKSGDADQAQKVILAKAIEILASVPGAKITIGQLRGMIAEQDNSLMNLLGGGYPPAYFEKLALRLNTLELANRRLLEGGEQVDIDALLGAKAGRVRLSIINTRFLGEATDFWVSQFLVAISRYCAKNPKPYLQAVFLFDEADKYLPASGPIPATKAPMEDLLKRARSAGLGMFLATQSPGDLDYKCRENLQTWFIGKVTQKTAIEKLKPLLEAAKGDVLGKLGGQTQGQFYLVRNTGVVPMMSFSSFLKTEQQSESEILELARR